MGDDDCYITLNVGGTCYKTSQLTLRSYPHSMLGKSFKKDGVVKEEGEGHLQRDKKGHFFIDRDGKMFRYILNFMRDGKLHLSSSFEEYDQLLAEAEFFKLSGLEKEISRMKPQPAPVVIADPPLKNSEVVILREIPSQTTTRTDYALEAEQQTWSKLTLASVDSVQSDESLRKTVARNNPYKKYGFVTQAYYHECDYNKIVLLLAKNGFKFCPAPPGIDTGYFMFTNI